MKFEKVLSISSHRTHVCGLRDNFIKKATEFLAFGSFDLTIRR